MASHFNKNGNDESSLDNVTFEGRTSTKSLRTRKIKCNESCFLAAPSSYTEKNEKESICEAIASDFAQIFMERYPQFSNRLMVMAENEFQVSKCVCSTLKPELLPYPTIHDSTECSDFIAHYFDYEPLEDPCNHPKTLPSPSQVLRWGIGDCFDLSIVLASFLIGAGYDAFVVYGIAPKWICSRDTSRLSSASHCNGKFHTFEMQPVVAKIVNNLRTMMTDTSSRCQNAHSDTHAMFDDKDRDEIQQDPLHGKRVHSWVLVKSNLRCPPGSTEYFIEPSTGHHYLPSSCPYLDIYAVWNNLNYWVNTREEKSATETSLATDDGWEPVFFNKGKVNSHINRDGGRMPFDPPFSWVDNLSISEDSFAFKYPATGRRVLFYEKRKIELFAEGVQKQGIEKRVTLFEDKGLLYPIQCIEYFSRLRKDSLSRRIKLPQSHSFHESFLPLNPSSIKEWIELSGERRIIHFHVKGRSDGLCSCDETFGEKIVHAYTDRRDRLSERIVHLIWVDEVKAKMKGRLFFPSGDGTQNAIVTKIM